MEEYDYSPSKSSEGGERFSVYIERVPAHGERDYFSLSDFLLTVAEENAAYVYGGCQWLKIEEIYDAENGRAQTLLLISRRRTVIKGV